MRTQDGAVYRGTLIEYVPGDHATIRLLNGTDRTVPGGSIVYAGPSQLDPIATTTPIAATTPAAAPAASTDAASTDAAADKVEVRFESTQGEITVYQRTGRATIDATNGRTSARATVHSFDEICTTPCTARMGVGRLPLALATGSLRPVMVPGGVDVSSGGTFQATFVNNRPMRIGGGVLIGASLAAAATLIGTSFPYCDYGPCDVYVGRIAAGAVVAVAGVIGGAIMASRKDVARLTPLAIHF